MKNKILLLLFSFVCVALCCQNIMAQVNDNVCDPVTVLDPTIPNPPAQTSVCTDNSDNALTFADPTSSLPDIDFVITVNDSIADINANGAFSADTLAEGDVVCVVAFTYDLEAINDLLNSAAELCPIIDCDAQTGVPGTNQLVADLVAGNNDGVPGLNSLQEALDFAGQFGGAVGTIADVQAALDGVNASQVGTLLDPICFATTESVCFDVVVCPACPNLTDITVTDSEVCSGSTSDVCFQFDDEVSNTLTAVVNGVEVEGVSGTEICVPVTTDNQTCDLAALAITVGLTCEGDDVDVSAFMLAPLDVYPDPANFTIAVTPSAGCGEAPVIVDSTCPTLVEEWAGGAAPAAGCTTDIDPANDPETDDYTWTQDYSVYSWFVDPFATNCVYPSDSGSETVIGCEDPALCAGEAYCDNICFVEYLANPTPDDFVDLTLCVTPLGCADAPDASCLTTTPCVGDCEIGDEVTVTLTDEVCTACGADTTPGCTDALACNFDPAACVDDASCLPVPVCNTDICVGDTEVVDPADACACIIDIVQVLGCTNMDAPNFDPAANCDDGSCDCVPDGCIDPLACNFDPAATCDDGTCEVAPVCNTDICLGDTEIVDPADACVCIVDEVQVLGCTDPVAPNFDPAANCDDGSCAACADGSIAGSVTVDDDCDGTGGDVPTTPLTVELYDAAGTLVGTATTDALGNYLFDPVPCGTYDVLVDETNLPPCSQGANPNPRVGVTVGDGEAVVAEDFDFQPINLACNGQIDWEDQEVCSVSGGIDITFPIVACSVTPEVLNPDGTYTIIGFDIYNPDVATGGIISTLFEAPSFGVSACVPEFTFTGFPENQTCDPQVYGFEIVTTIFTVNADGSLVGAVTDSECGTEVFTATIYPSLTATDVSLGNCGDRQVDLLAEDGTVCDSQIQACDADGIILDADFTGTAFDYGQGCSVLTASTNACDSSPLLVECVDIARACESNSIYVIAPGADTSVDFPMPLMPDATWEFEWSLNGTVVDTNIGHPYYSPSATGTYTVVIYNYDTCEFWETCTSFEVTEIINCSDCDND